MRTGEPTPPCPRDRPGRRPGHTVQVVRDRLVARGLPARRAVRYARELRAHREDLRAELLAAGHSPAGAEAEADRRLGGADELVAAAVRGHRAESFGGRHPLACYVLVPFLLVPLLPALLIAAVVLALSDHSAGETRTASARVQSSDAGAIATVYGMACAATYVLPAALAAAVTRSARRRTLSARWACAACTAVALSAGLQGVRLSTVRGEHPARMGVHYGLPPDRGPLCFVLATAGGTAWLAARRDRPPPVPAATA